MNIDYLMSSGADVAEQIYATTGGDVHSVLAAVAGILGQIVYLISENDGPEQVGHFLGHIDGMLDVITATQSAPAPIPSFDLNFKVSSPL